MRDRQISLALFKSLKEDHYQGKIALAATHQNDAEHFKKMGVDMVLIPYQDAAAEAVNRLMTQN